MAAPPGHWTSLQAKHDDILHAEMNTAHNFAVSRGPIGTTALAAEKADLAVAEKRALAAKWPRTNETSVKAFAEELNVLGRRNAGVPR